LLSNKNIQKYFLTKTSQIISDSKVDLILSPEFYWVRVFEIPVKSKHDALDVLPTLFEDVLPQGEFSYHVIKEEKQKYLCFAYENKNILECIKKSNLNLSQINNIYFAQTEFKEISRFVSGKNAFMYSLDDILIKVPPILIQDAINIDQVLDTHKVSAHKVKIKFYSSLINSKLIYTFMSIFAVLITLNVFKYVVYNKNISILEVKSAQVKKSYNLPRSMLETNSVVSKMKRKIIKGTKLRESLDYIFDFKNRQTKGKLKQVNYSGNSIKLLFEDISYSQVKTYLSKKFKIIKNSKNKNQVRFEVKI